MSRDSIPSFVSNLVKILSNWITWFPYDFQVQYKVGGVAALRVLELLQGFGVKCENLSENYWDIWGKLRKNQYLNIDSTRVHYNAVQSTVQYSTVQYSTVQYSTVQYSTVQYSTVQYSTDTVQYSTVQYSSVQFSSVQFSAK